MTAQLGSAAVPPIEPPDHVRGSGPETTLYIDLACPHCAVVWARIRELPLRHCVRHFPVKTRRPRSPALHAAAEAVASQGGEEAFWSFWDGLLADQAHQDDPHLWQRVEALGLDLDRFESERRSDLTSARVKRDFQSGIRAGVVGTPAGFLDGEPIEGDLGARLANL